MSSTLHIAIEEKQGSGNVAVLILKGELDGSTYKDLQAKVDEITAGGSNNFLIDMSGLSFMGSAGLRALHSSSNSAKDNGGAVKLLNPSEAAGRVMKTLGFDQFYEVYSNLDEAISSF